VIDLAFQTTRNSEWSSFPLAKRCEIVCSAIEVFFSDPRLTAIMACSQAISAVKTDPLTELTEGYLAMQIEMTEARKRISDFELEVKGQNSVDVIDDVSNFAIFLTTRILLGSLIKGTAINCCADSTPN